MSGLKGFCLLHEKKKQKISMYIRKCIALKTWSYTPCQETALNPKSKWNCKTFCFRVALSLSSCYATISNCCCLSRLSKCPSVPNSKSQTGPGSMCACSCVRMFEAYFGQWNRRNSAYWTQTVLHYAARKSPLVLPPIQPTQGLKGEHYVRVYVRAFCLHGCACVCVCTVV